MEIEVKRLIRAIRRYWWMPLALMLLLGVLGYGIGTVIPKSYTATTQLLVVPIPSGAASIIEDGNRAASYQHMVETGPVQDAVIRELGLDMTREELDEHIVVSIVPGTQIIQIDVTHSDPQKAADIANTITSSFVSQVTELTSGDLRLKLSEAERESASIRDRITVINTRLDELDVPENEDDSEVTAEINALRAERLQLEQTQVDLQGTIRQVNTQLVTITDPVSVIDSAEVPENTSSPSPLLLAIVGAVLGLLLGGALMLLREWRDNTVVDAEDVERAIGARTQVSDTRAVGDGGSSLTEARIRALAANNPGMALVSPRVVNSTPGYVSEQENVPFANGLLENTEALEALQGHSSAVIISQLDRSKSSDLVETAALLREMGIDVVAGVANR